jgi:hypothetical protein
LNFPSERSSELKPYLFNAFKAKLSPNETTETSKLDLSLFKNLSSSLKLHDIIEDLMQTSTMSQQGFNQILTDFPNQREDDIFQCILKMANNSQVNDDIILRTANIAYATVKTSKKLMIFCKNLIAEFTLSIDEWERLKFKDNNEKKALSWNFDVFIKGVNDNFPFIKASLSFAKQNKLN